MLKLLICSVLFINAGEAAQKRSSKMPKYLGLQEDLPSQIQYIPVEDLDLDTISPACYAMGYNSHTIHLGYAARANHVSKARFCARYVPSLKSTFFGQDTEEGEAGQGLLFTEILYFPPSSVSWITGSMKSKSENQLIYCGTTRTHQREMYFCRGKIAKKGYLLTGYTFNDDSDDKTDVCNVQFVGNRTEIWPYEILVVSSFGMLTDAYDEALLKQRKSISAQDVQEQHRLID